MWKSLLLIQGVREERAHRDEHFKRAVARYHNSRVKPSRIQVGDLILRKNQVSRQESTWKLDAYV